MNVRSIFYLQSPAGNTLPLGKLIFPRQPDTEWIGGLSGATPVWFGSGTMAIAGAIRVACKVVRCERPKVVVAAYGCPDVVAAIRYAGAEPHYVDLEKNRIGMSMRGLAEAIERESGIVAILGADLFGIPEQWSAIKLLLSQSRMLLIQDFAQSMQVPGIAELETVGDIAIFSFGRGKPVSLLGGGVMAVRNRQLCLDELLGGLVDPAARQLSVPLLKFALYNTAIRPVPYAMAARLLGKRIGTTVYRPVTEILGVSGLHQRRTLTAVSDYFQEHVDRFDAVAEAVRGLNQNGNGKVDCGLFESAYSAQPDRRFTRCPILVEAGVREKLIERLCRRGVSATRMYGRTLPEIVSGEKPADIGEKYPNALDVASRLVTLPVHNRIRDRDLIEIESVFRHVLAI